ncbi:DUF4974 domain-containing protein [Chitinophaga agrisoli]|uniref:DUF4974 domain-containing protein n=1 Tax=Chitinophaga agrisoli TaxID=2607653 RepID=A0A5B2VI05_9BACT|nr:FecR family protein [Chitinophaga agrisoli]KAA2238535.1 DUF4974 domain-containing protein [Chitinophaga agrisoli]
MQSARLEYLLQQHTTASLTPQEQQELDLFLANEGNRDDFTAIVTSMLAQQQPTTDLPTHWHNIPDRILAMDKPTPIKRLPVWKQIAAAAAILALLIAGGTLWFSHKTPAPIAQQPHIPPGSNKAILTLANGSTIPLDSNGNQLIHQGNTAIRQTGGLLHYDNNNNTATAISYNTLTTPRGGQFQVRLPDGTQAWLNAASSLRYPTLFTGLQRIVEVTGEVYFEVAANAAQPFIVQSSGLEITVLGTHFNVNTYKDDGTLRVTLLEGAVKVKGDGSPVTLQPGQEAIISNNNINIATADEEQAMAWKNGFFVFRNASIGMVFNQLSRWYNMDVQYNENLKDKRFVGKMPRSYSLEEISAVLNESGVYITIVGNKIQIQEPTNH